MKYERLRQKLVEVLATPEPFSPPEHDASKLEEAARLLEAEYSFDETRKALYNALRLNRYTTEGAWIYRWIRDVYAEHLVYEEEVGDSEKLYKATYSIGEDGVATLGTPVEVRIEYVTVATSTDLNEADPLHESGNLHEGYTPLKERAIRDDGTMQVKIIGPGKGSSGYYSREVIERDIPRVFPRNTHMMANHQTEMEEMERPEGKIEDLAAVFVSDPYYLEESAAPEGEGAYVDVKPFADYQPMLEDKAEAIGVSINAGGDVIFGEVDGQVMPIVERITVGKTVDFVTKAGRDGRIVSLKEAARIKSELPASTWKEFQEANNPNRVAESSQPVEIPNTPPEETVNEQEIAALRESATTAQTKADALQRQLLTMQAERVLESTLAGEKYNALPAPVKARITESLKSAPVEKDGALDTEAFVTKIEESVQAEVAYLNAANGSTGEVEGCGAGDSTPVKESAAPRDVINVRASIGLS